MIVVDRVELASMFSSLSRSSELGTPPLLRCGKCARVVAYPVSGVGSYPFDFTRRWPCECIDEKAPTRGRKEPSDTYRAVRAAELRELHRELPPGARLWATSAPSVRSPGLEPLGVEPEVPDHDETPLDRVVARAFDLLDDATMAYEVVARIVLRSASPRNLDAVILSEARFIKMERWRVDSRAWKLDPIGVPADPDDDEAEASPFVDPGDRVPNFDLDLEALVTAALAFDLGPSGWPALRQIVRERGVTSCAAFAALVLGTTIETKPRRLAGMYLECFDLDLREYTRVRKAMKM